MQLKIMRGAPGSGKTRYVGTNFPGAVVISADHYHTTADGKYEYKLENVPMAHNRCVLACVTALQRSLPLVVIDNTNIRVWELAVYYRLGEAFGYEVEIITLLAPADLCKSRNTHGVPAKTIDAMVNGMEPLAPHWKPATLVWTGGPS